VLLYKYREKYIAYCNKITKGGIVMKMKDVRKGMVVLCAVSMAYMMMGCGSKGEASNTQEAAAEQNVSEESTSIEGLVTPGTLTVVIDPTSVPTAYLDENENLIGFDIEIAKEIANYLGLEIEFITNSFDNLIPTVQAGKADAVTGGVYVTEERKKVVDYCTSYYELSEVIVVEKGNDEIQVPEDLIGKRVGVQPASSDLEDVKALGVEDISEYTKIPDGIMDITNGRIDAFVTESCTGLYYAADGNYDVRLDAPLGTFPVGIITNKKAPEVTAAMNEAIAALTEDGTLSRISMECFGEDIIIK